MACVGEADALLRDFVEWVAEEPRTEQEIAETWRRSTALRGVWEEALTQGLVTRVSSVVGDIVVVTGLGHNLLSNDRQRT